MGVSPLSPSDAPSPLLLRCRTYLQDSFPDHRSLSLQSAFELIISALFLPQTQEPILPKIAQLIPDLYESAVYSPSTSPLLRSSYALEPTIRLSRRPLWGRVSLIFSSTRSLILSSLLPLLDMTSSLEP